MKVANMDRFEKLSDVKRAGIIPEEYDANLISNIPSEIIKRSEMIDCERRFINGLLCLFQPKRVLEVGVSAGTGSAVIYNAIRDLDGSELLSVDVSPNYYRKKEMPTGYLAESFIGADNPRWHRAFGQDFSALEDLPDSYSGGAIDFLVIDTVHIHPVETLNFLTILPHLSENAMVVIHDVALFQNDMDKKKCDFMRSFACHMLLSNIVGEKMQIKKYAEADKPPYYCNIGAIQINSDTRKYVSNLFYSLQFPWGFINLDFENIGKSIKKYYRNEYYKMYQIAKQANLILYKNKFQAYDETYMPELTTSDSNKPENNVSSVYFRVKRETSKGLFLLSIPVDMGRWYSIYFEICFDLLTVGGKHYESIIAAAISVNPETKTLNIDELSILDDSEIVEKLYYIVDLDGFKLYSRLFGRNSCLHINITKILLRNPINNFLQPQIYSRGDIGESSLINIPEKAEKLKRT